MLRLSRRQAMRCDDGEAPNSWRRRRIKTYRIRGSSFPSTPEHGRACRQVGLATSANPGLMRIYRMEKRELEGREEEFLVRYDAVRGSLVLGLAGCFRREGAELGFLSAATRRGCSVYCAQRGAADGKLGFGCSSARAEKERGREGERRRDTHTQREREMWCRAQQHQR